ncbi:MAG: undecaprenyl-phosphate glucose phosphotransferase [Chitinophagaceae bacterium]|nr:undecaprenyl-phosphate glucose phosphotransferase [Chitinophagaceae bacterium]
MIRSDQRLMLLYSLADFFILIAVFTATHILFRGHYFMSRDFLDLITFSLLWFIATSVNKVYLLHLHNSLKYRLINHLKGHFAFAGVLALIYLLFGIPEYTRQHFIVMLIAFPVCDLFVNFLLYKLVGMMRINGKNIRKALIVGTGKVSENIQRYFEQNPDFGYKVVGFLDDNVDKLNHQSQVLGTIGDLDKVLKEIHIDEVIITLPAHMDNEIQFVIDKVDYYGIRIRLVPDYFRLLGRNFKTTSMGDTPIINIREISLDRLRFATWKRFGDIAFSIAVLFFLFPVFIVLAILIKLESPGPIFYCPVRLGQGGRQFKLFKFRSMSQNDPEFGGAISTQKNDPRITKLGRTIRKYSLDELPQFVNVLMGDMSVVGPRPHRIQLNQVMQKEVDNYMVRHYLKPGITGWAQVNGWRGPTDTEEQKHNRTQHDLWYVENWSPLLDFKIVFLTMFGEKTHKEAF